ncbi:MAG: DUF3659 domain-containing protein [Cellvibrionaceae bacterium]
MIRALKMENTLNTFLQRGQSSTEYIVVTAAIVFAMLQPIVPPGVLSCPATSLQSVQSEEAGSDSCSVVEMFGQLFRNRSEGYTYAISASEYPEMLISLDDVDLGFSDDDDSSGGSSDDGSSDDDDSDDTFDDYDPSDTGIGIDTSSQVAVNSDGEIIGNINDDGQVVDEDGEIIGVVMDDGSIVAAESDGSIIYDDEGGTTSLGEQASVNGDGEIVALDGTVLGTIDTE